MTRKADLTEAVAAFVGARFPGRILPHTAAEWADDLLAYGVTPADVREAARAMARASDHPTLRALIECALAAKRARQAAQSARTPRAALERRTTRRREEELAAQVAFRALCRDVVAGAMAQDEASAAATAASRQASVAPWLRRWLAEHPIAGDEAQAVAARDEAAVVAALAWLGGEPPTAGKGGNGAP